MIPGHMLFSFTKGTCLAMQFLLNSHSSSLFDSYIVLFKNYPVMVSIVVTDLIIKEFLYFICIF